jgi:hypothetical protein
LARRQVNVFTAQRRSPVVLARERNRKNLPFSRKMATIPAKMPGGSCPHAGAWSV